VAETEVASVSIRDAGAVSPALKRVGSAAVLIPVFVWITMGAPSWVFQLLVVAASVVACLELARMFERTGRPINTWLTVGVGGALTASFATSLYGITSFGGRDLVLLLGVGLICSAPLWTSGKPQVESTANTLFGAIYVGLLLGYAIWLHGGASGPQLVLFLVGVTWAGESAAYLVGSSLGRRRLAPILSPRKTFEGAAAQVVVSVAMALALSAWLLPGCGLVGAAGAGVVLGVIGQIGDLAESAIKRSIGTKDTGGLIPGHGGMLDRIDSLLFNAPALYLYSMYAWCRA
jgi:phosphatidate cytidylyltransferase